MHSISVIISNFNGAKYLPRLLSTLRQQQGVSLEIIVVDRNSTDGSDAILAANPDVKVIKHPPETGLVSGYATGADSASQDLLFFCNEDMWFEPDCLALVAGQINLPGRICAAMPVQWTYDGSDVVNAGIWFVRSLWSRASPYPFRGAGWHLPRCTAIVPAVNAGACMIHRKVYEEIGGWDRTFFLDYEDGDICLRMWQHDWLGVVVPDARVYHAVGASNSQVLAKARTTVSRKRYIEGSSNVSAMAIKSFTGISVLLPLLAIIDRMARNVLKGRFKLAWWDVCVYGALLRRLPWLLEWRHLNKRINRAKPGQGYFCDPRFDYSAIQNNRQEITPVLPPGTVSLP